MTARICVDFGDKISSIYGVDQCQLYNTGKLLFEIYNSLETAQKFLLTASNINPSYYRTIDNFIKTEEYNLEDYITYLRRLWNGNIYLERKNTYIYMFINNRWYYLTRSSDMILHSLTKGNTTKREKKIQVAES